MNILRTPSFFCFLGLGAFTAIGVADPTPADPAKQAEQEAKSGQVKEAIADYTLAINLNPKNVQLYLQRGLAELRAGDAKAYFADCDKAISIDPSNVAALYLRAKGYDITGNCPKAIQDYSSAIAVYPASTDFLLGRGVDRMKTGDHAGAIADFSAALQINPHLAQAVLARASAYSAAGMYPQAIGDFTILINANPKAAQLYVSRGKTYALIGRFDQAIQDETQAVQIAPNLIAAYAERALFEFQAGKDREALPDFQRIMAQVDKELPLDAIPTMCLIWALQVEATHDTAAADKDLEAALSRVKAGSESTWQVLIGHYFLGKATEDVVLKALPTEPKEGTLTHGLVAFYFGMHHLVTDDKAGAISLFNQAAAVKDPNLSESALAKSRLTVLSDKANPSLAPTSSAP